MFTVLAKWYSRAFWEQGFHDAYYRQGHVYQVYRTEWRRWMLWQRQDYRAGYAEGIRSGR